MKPAKPKRPAKSMASSFARHVDDSGQISGWTLFRRSSVTRRVFRKPVSVASSCRRQMAQELAQARMVLRAVVDHHDLKKMGLN